MSDFPRGVSLAALPAPAAALPAPHVAAAEITAQYAIAPEHYLMRLRDAPVARGAPGGRNRGSHLFLPVRMFRQRAPARARLKSLAERK